jgi:hypothetical protein
MQLLLFTVPKPQRFSPGDIRNRYLGANLMLNRYGEEASEESGRRADDPPPAAGVANDHLACGNCGLFWS